MGEACGGGNMYCPDCDSTRDFADMISSGWEYDFDGWVKQVRRKAGIEDPK